MISRVDLLLLCGLFLGLGGSEASGQSVKTRPRPRTGEVLLAGYSGVAPERQVEVEFDSVSGQWVTLDSAMMVQRQRERWIEQAKRIFGAEWPWVEEPIHMLDSPFEDEAFGLLREGKMREAEKIVRKALREVPENAEVACSLADLYATQMRADTSAYAARKWLRKAEAAYQNALRLDRGSHRINFNLSVLYRAYWAKGHELKVAGMVSYPGFAGSTVWWKARVPLERAYL
ncbi:MAG: tetratricopeptide repeat protein, partial [Flavobacteriales bacterium]|nr:tetratricopeptide repeat protein [Flavobacteriales bacterium]